MGKGKHGWMRALRGFRKNNQSVFMTWLVSYISVLLVPIIISGIIYMATLHVVKTEIDRANESILMQMEQAIDSQFKRIKSLSYEVGLNTTISGFITVDADFSDSDHYEIYQIAKDLKVYELGNDFIENIYIYYQNSNTVIAKNERLQGESLHEVLRFNEYTPYEEFKNFFEQRYVQEYRPIFVKTGEQWFPSVMYAQSVVLPSRGQPGAVLLFVIDHNQLLEQAPVPDDGSVMILDEKNRMIASTSSTEMRGIDYEDMPDQSGQVHNDSTGQKVVASYTTSPITGWKYVITLPAKVYHQKMNTVKRMTFVSFLLCLLVGGVVTTIFLRRNYTPIYTLIQSLSYKAGVHFNEGSNEFQFLQQALNNTFNEKEELNMKLNQHNSTIRTYFLQRLLKGQLDSSIPLHESFSAHDVYFSSSHFSVLLLRIEHFGKFAQETDDQVRDSHLLHFLISNVVEELARKSAQAYAVELDNEMLACIVNFKNSDSTEHRAELVQIAEETKSFILQHTLVKLSIAISTPHEGEYGISQAFQEALEAMEYRVVIGSGGVIHYDDLNTQEPKASPSGYFYPLKAEQQLIGYIREGNANRAEALLEEIIHKNVSLEPFSSHSAKCLMFDMMGTMMKAINEVRTTNKPNILDGAYSIERLMSFQTIREMKEHIREVLRQICTYVNDSREYHHNPLIDDVMKYVSDHYQDENLNISMIGEAFAMTPSYVSKLFKEQNGKSLLDYINKTRLKQAKILLSEQKYTVSEVAVMVGYCDVNTFYRIFKKFEGITPGSYKEIQ